MALLISHLIHELLDNKIITLAARNLIFFIFQLPQVVVYNGVFLCFGV
jgi:hypothetical protein